MTMKHVINTKTKDGDSIEIEIRLDDECGNGHQDFAITATVWEKGKPRTDRFMICGGCCHDEILAARPDLKQFIDLHLCDYLGIPMYAAANGFYHLKQGFNSTPSESPDFPAAFCDYYRITADQFAELSKSVNKIEYALTLEKLGVFEQWKAQADLAIARLEKLTGQTFVNTSRRTQYDRPSDTEIEDYRAQLAAGYFTEAAIAERDRAAADAFVADLEKKRDQEIADIRAAADLKMQVYRIGGEKAYRNSIVYAHTKKLAFNWLSYEKPISDDLIAAIADQIIWPDGYSLGKKEK